MVNNPSMSDMEKRIMAVSLERVGLSVYLAEMAKHYLRKQAREIRAERLAEANDYAFLAQTLFEIDVG